MNLKNHKIDYKIILFFLISEAVVTNSKTGWDSYEIPAEDPYEIDMVVFTYNKKDLAKFILAV